MRFFLKKTDDLQLIKVGFIISILSLISVMAFAPIVNIRELMIPCYFIYSVGSAFLVPSLFSVILKKHQPHEQGKMCGLMDSTDTVALLGAAAFAFYYKDNKLNAIYVTYFSFLVFMFSIYTYYRFKKLSKNVENINK